MEEVFEYSTNPANTHKWIDFMEKEWIDLDVIKEGAVYKNKSLQGVVSSYDLVLYKPCSVFELHSKTSDFCVKYTYKDLGDNKTELTYREWDDVVGIENPFEQKHLDALKREMEKSFLRKYQTSSLSEFNTIARQILTELLEAPADQPVVVGLVGDLGAGKTTLVQTWAKELGVDRVVTSPTFTLVQTYETNSLRFSTLVHADLYRLEEDRELKTVGGDQWGSNPAQLVVVEWPHQISSMADKLTKVITITEPTPESREITIT